VYTLIHWLIDWLIDLLFNGTSTQKGDTYGLIFRDKRDRLCLYYNSRNLFSKNFIHQLNHYYWSLIFKTNCERTNYIANVVHCKQCGMYESMLTACTCMVTNTVQDILVYRTIQQHTRSMSHLKVRRAVSHHQWPTSRDGRDQTNHHTVTAPFIVQQYEQHGTEQPHALDWLV